MKMAARLRPGANSKDDQARVLALGAIENLIHLQAMLRLKRWQAPLRIVLPRCSPHTFTVIVCQLFSQALVALVNDGQELADIAWGIERLAEKDGGFGEQVDRGRDGLRAV
jgi:hypothetical protein